MISYEYGFLLRNPSISVAACQLMGDSRDLLVELGTERRHIMAYVLLQMKDGGALMLRLCLANLME